MKKLTYLELQSRWNLPTMVLDNQSQIEKEVEDRKSFLNPIFFKPNVLSTHKKHY